MQNIKENMKKLSYILSIPIVNILYMISSNSTRKVHSLVTSLDMGIPFVKAFIIPYVIWYPFIIITLIYFLIKDKEIYFKALISIDIGIFISSIIYFLFQTTVLRPGIYGNDILSQITRFVYSTDKPFNCCPSIHALTSFIMIRAILGSSIKNYKNVFVITFGAVLIIISTLFVKQHVIFDLVAAILLGNIIFYAVDNFNKFSCFLLNMRGKAVKNL